MNRTPQQKVKVDEVERDKKREDEKMTKMDLDSIYTPQSFLEEKKVQEKMLSKNYRLKYTMIKDDDAMIAILVDGNHALEAAKRNEDMTKIEIEEVENHAEKTVERYVMAFGDLDNPESLITRTYLW